MIKIAMSCNHWCTLHAVGPILFQKYIAQSVIVGEDIHEGVRWSAQNGVKGLFVGAEHGQGE